MWGAYWIPAARFLAPPSGVLGGVPSENGVGKLTTCADRRGPAFGRRPAHTSPDFVPMRKSSISGEVVGDAWKSGLRDLVRMSYGRGLLDSGGARSDVLAARFSGSFRRKQGPEIV